MRLSVLMTSVFLLVGSVWLGRRVASAHDPGATPGGKPTVGTPRAEPQVEGFRPSGPPPPDLSPFPRDPRYRDRPAAEYALQLQAAVCQFAVCGRLWARRAELNITYDFEVGQDHQISRLHPNDGAWQPAEWTAADQAACPRWSSSEVSELLCFIQWRLPVAPGTQGTARFHFQPGKGWDTLEIKAYPMRAMLRVGIQEP